jgi:predicted nuclease with TOPRIM domain
MAGTEITHPVRALIRERNSLKAERDALQEEIQHLQQKKADFLANFEKQAQKLLDQKEDLLTRWGEFNEAIKTLTPEVATEEKPAPEDDPNADSTT